MAVAVVPQMAAVAEALTQPGPASTATSASTTPTPAPLTLLTSPAAAT